ncbi:unnamed protein product [Lactuca saligna]|uniref:SRP54-type proteins GTP-binding domain-containing protein n=1 Tax=Lactuca saligna TaxID=75948 RepID=A0AA35UTZ1_LACSI|nr:unnamed protein product [Lactuca saligna]
MLNVGTNLGILRLFSPNLQYQSFSSSLFLLLPTTLRVAPPPNESDKQVDAPVYAVGTNVKPAEIARQDRQKYDDELKNVKRTLNPTKVLLLVDTMTGQEAADGDSRGGAAPSVKEVSENPIKLVGRGERMEDLEPFYPDRMAERILGMGDVLSFVEKAQEVMKQEVAEDLQKKIMSAKFDFNDFLKQTRVVARMGSMSRVFGMIPGMGKPELLAESPARRKRIAQESGKIEQQYSKLYGGHS